MWSERPLRLEELVDAIAVQPNVIPRFDPKNRMPEPSDIMRVCSSLVVPVERPHNRDDTRYVNIDRGSHNGELNLTELQLAHFSVKEYLVSDRITSSFSSCLAGRMTRASLATLCLACLSDLNHNLSLDEIRARFAFSQYCARYWTDHAKAANGVDEKLQNGVQEFVEDREDAYLTCCNLYNPEQP